LTFAFLGPDPLAEQVDELLHRLASGEAPENIESRQVECKEERGRRGPRGAIAPGLAENDAAARHLADELACLANSPGGGAIILGVADDGQRIGTALDAEWLRHRIYELTNRQLTVDVRVATLDETRVLVLMTHEALEPIRGPNGRVHWRVDHHCVEVDPTTWHTGRLHRSGIDWSALPSGHTLDDVSATALEVARGFLQEAAESGDVTAAELLDATNADLLRRLNLVADAKGTLTNGGSLLFVGTPDDGIDYIRRDVPGGDSTNRTRSNRPLLVQVHEVDQAVRAANRVLHSGDGLAKGQLRAIPMRAAREAIVNGVVHRDWLTTEPTTVEHTGDTLTVTSPGGLPGGVRPDNIITHPSSPRYKCLAEAMASLRLAEREGIGVDRMVGDMLALGRPEPEIAELEGPSVRVSLIGGDPDPEVIRFLSDLRPPKAVKDLDIVLLVDHLTSHGFVDTATAQLLLQRPPGETTAAIQRGLDTTIDGQSIIVPINGVPLGHPPAYRLSDVARDRLPGRLSQLRSASGRNWVILTWARARGRVSSTEVADLTGLSLVRSGQILTELEQQGELAPGKEVKLGRGFFYTPADS
jgi:ATP-dependent DNA helicase RecG